MKNSKIKIFSTTCIAILTGQIIAFNNVIAQIIPDATLGTERSVITPNLNIKGAAADEINGGAIRGSNIFHSFSEFNIKDGQRVYFANPSGINNILGRITGNNPSNLLGTLGVNGNANLFFINPNGIVFGKNASLDIGSSFYVTTANSIKFDELGEFSATNPQAPGTLLSINPSAFFFNARTNPASIITQSRVTKTVQGTPTDGLQVPNGRVLLLLGGNVTVDDGRLIARGGRVEIGAVAGTGSVGLNPNGSLNFPDTIQRGDVVFNNTAPANRSGIDVRSSNSGDVGITSRSISLNSGSQIRAGITANLGTKESIGGDVTVNATGEVRMNGDDTRIANDVRENAIGKAGNIMVKANSLVVTNGAQLSSSTFGVGDAGNITVAAERVLFSGTRTDERGASAAFSRVEPGARGNGGIVQIYTKVLEVYNGAAISSATLGNGNAGNIIIEASESVSFDGSSPNKVFDSGAFSNVSRDADGKGGNIEITTGLITLTNRAYLNTSTNGKKDAGNITINAPLGVEVTGVGFIDNSPTALFAQTLGAGNAGNININTARLLIEDVGTIQAVTFGKGRAGNIDINTEQLLIRNSPIAISANTTNRVDAGDAGNITINTGSLSLVNSQIGSITSGKGNAGFLTVRASDSVEISGKINIRNVENPAGLLAQVNVGGTGRGGNLRIEAKRLSVSNGAKVQVATFGQGDAGKLFIRAADIELFNTTVDNLFATGINSGVEIDPDETKVPPLGNGGELRIETERLSVKNGATVSSASSGKGNAGPLQINASDFIEVAGTSPTGNFKSQITAAITPNGIGNGGNLRLETGKIIVRDGGEITVSSLGAGVAGNLDIEADSINLDNQGTVTATTKSGNGGNIILTIQDLLLLRRGGKISTNAGTNSTGGDGGNININAKFIIASPNENSDITANAFLGSGGKININTASIFGLKPITRQELERLLQTNEPQRLDPVQLKTSDITAISQTNPSLNGEINLNTLENRTRVTEDLPTDIVDASGLVNQNLCVASIGSEFIVTGRGGLSASPYGIVSINPTWEDWTLLRPQVSTTNTNSPEPTPKEYTPIIEAQGWATDINGDVILTAKPIKVLPKVTWSHPLSCQTGRVFTTEKQR
jgi:filamentous hemagglutinin family protein